MRPRLARGLAFGGGVFLAAVWALTLAQRFGGSGAWWIELSRFLPTPLLLVPAALACALGWRSGAGWRFATLATLVLIATVGMGAAWSLGAAPAEAGLHLRLMTWNAKTVQASGRPGGIEALLREVARQHPDVLVMQDANALRHQHDTEPAVPMFGLAHVWGEGQYLVASRFPLEGCTEVATGSLGYVRCTVLAGAAGFELRTVHFESPRAGLLAARREGAEGIEAWRANLDERLLQSRAMAAALGGAPRPLVVAGDLNAAESSDVVGHLLAAGLRDAFSAAGRGWGYTYGHTLRPAFSFLRIDHILVSPQIAVIGCETGSATASDHRPVIADLALAP